MDVIRSVIAFSMPIAWMYLFLHRTEHHRRTQFVANCLLMVSGMMSLIAFKFDPFRNAPSSLQILVSPLLHADYLHLCLNIFGGFLVLNQLEVAIGKRRSVVMIALALTAHISTVWLLAVLTQTPIEVLGLSWTIFTALGYLLLLRFSTYKTAQKISFCLVLFLMSLIEVSTQTIVVHGLAILFGGGLSLLLSKLTDTH